MKYAILLTATLSTGCVAFPERDHHTLFDERPTQAAICSGEHDIARTTARNVTVGSVASGAAMYAITLGTFPGLALKGALVGAGVGAGEGLHTYYHKRNC